LNYDVPNNDTDVCHNNEPDKCTTYGRLYDWATAMGIETKYNNELLGGDVLGGGGVKRQGICLTGWHIPNSDEWSALIRSAGDEDENYSGLNAGTNLRANSALWNTNTGTDKFGFAALPGGDGNLADNSSSQGFWGVGNYGIWWSSYETKANSARYYKIDKTETGVYVAGNEKTMLKSVRCIKD